MTIEEELRRLPSVDRLIQEEAVARLAERWGHALAVGAAREALDAARASIRAGVPRPSPAELADQVEARLALHLRPTLRPVINATGVIVHTNLGRAPLSPEARAAIDAVGTGYSNLEYDLDTGSRGSRYAHAEELLCRLTGAEAALVVNNNAAAVLLVLTALARRMEVILSRGQLVEIGGGFRIPDVMRQSGAALVEVGTTNRTYVDDFRAAVTQDSVALMRVHHSNFRLSGFVHEPSLAELVALAREQDLLVIDDLGSGTLLDTAAYGLSHEPTIQESVAAGASLVTCSGDKLLGATQAGIILGRSDLVAQLKRFPLTRALRVDKATLAGLQATLLHYLLGEAPDKVPVWRMIGRAEPALREQAEAWVRRLTGRQIPSEAVPGRSTVGGGSLPGETLPTWLLALSPAAGAGHDAVAARLRRGDPALVARIEDGRLVLDPRTVLPEQADLVPELLVRALHGNGHD